jgi:hypothetical protein
MDNTKPWYTSRGVWGGVVAVVASGMQLAGYAVTPADQAALAEGAAQLGGLVVSGVTLVGGAISIWGRIRATHAIGGRSAPTA